LGHLGSMKLPPVEALVDRDGTRYDAVVIAAVRARQVKAGAAALEGLGLVIRSGRA
jgi:DNA-directed RNA polymerase subunit K/omega